MTALPSCGLTLLHKEWQICKIRHIYSVISVWQAVRVWQPGDARLRIFILL